MLEAFLDWEDPEETMRPAQIIFSGGSSRPSRNIRQAAMQGHLSQVAMARAAFGPRSGSLLDGSVHSSALPEQSAPSRRGRSLKISTSRST